MAYHTTRKHRASREIDEKPSSPRRWLDHELHVHYLEVGGSCNRFLDTCFRGFAHLCL